MPRRSLAASPPDPTAHTRPSFSSNRIWKPASSTGGGRGRVEGLSNQRGGREPALARLTGLLSIEVLERSWRPDGFVVVLSASRKTDRRGVFMERADQGQNPNTLSQHGDSTRLRREASTQPTAPKSAAARETVATDWQKPCEDVRQWGWVNGTAVGDASPTEMPRPPGIADDLRCPIRDPLTGPPAARFSGADIPCRRH